MKKGEVQLSPNKVIPWLPEGTTLWFCIPAPRYMWSRGWNETDGWHGSKMQSFEVRRGQRVLAGLAWKWEGNSIKSYGTYVSRGYQRRGIATALWSRMLRMEQPKNVTVSVISDRGLTLVESLRRRYRRIHWSVYDDGDRKLRRLS